MASSTKNRSKAGSKSGQSGEDWSGYAIRVLREAGLRNSSTRQSVIEEIGAQNCAVTALDIDAALPSVGRATVYRVIERLEDQGLIHRVDLGVNATGYEKVDPTGEHHHHIVCEKCGRVETFVDEALEKAVGRIKSKEFSIQTHEITLWGTCGKCD
ncbi:MAG: Fur family transcriptional regulator [Solirubrobacterales bacterium]